MEPQEESDKQDASPSDEPPGQPFVDEVTPDWWSTDPEKSCPEPDSEEAWASDFIPSIASFKSDNSSTEKSTPEDIRNASYRPRAGPYCLHETVQRYWSYDPEVYLQCENNDCNHFVRFLYECTADTADFSPYIDSLPERSISILPEWTQKAVAENQYTPSEVEKLLDQKMQVLLNAADMRGKVIPTHRALPGGRGLSDDWEAIEDRNYREVMQLLSAKTLKFSSLQPCRAMFCTMCRAHSSENAWGSIAKIVNKPYKEPIPTPANLYRPVTNAWCLRDLPRDPTKWQHSVTFRGWWKKNQYVAGNDLMPILTISLRLEFSFEFLQTISYWVFWQQMPGPEYQDYVNWLETLPKSELLEHVAQINPWTMGFHSEDLSYRYLSPGSRPVPLSRHPIWEEVELEGDGENWGETYLTSVPYYGYGVWDRFAGRSTKNLRETSYNYNCARSRFLSEKEKEGFSEVERFSYYQYIPDPLDVNEWTVYEGPTELESSETI